MVPASGVKFGWVWIHESAEEKVLNANRAGASHHATLRYAFAGYGPGGGQGLRDLLTETQNVSARGVFFYLDRPLAEGMRIEVTMTFPPHVTLTEPVRVRFTARVVRVETSPAHSSIGVAAMIEEYEFLRSNAASEFSSEVRYRS